MPVNANYAPNEYIGNGSTTQFAYTFRVIQTGDLKVSVDGVVLSSGYSVSGVNNLSGGNVTFTTAPASGAVIRLYREIVQNRTTDYQEGGGLASQTLDDDFDRVVMMVQETTYGTIPFISATDSWDAQGSTITNVGAPAASTDAATKGYADTLWTANLATITSHKNSAATSESNCLTYKNNVVEMYTDFNNHYTAQTSQPVNPIEGQIWWDKTNNILKVYNGSSWESYASSTTELAAIGSRRNVIINGNFDVWQRGTSQNTSGYGSADRWLTGFNGSGVTATRQTLSPGNTTIPSSPKYHYQAVVTPVAGASNYSSLSQRIEGVHTLQGRSCAVSFYARCVEGATDIAMEFVQGFGTGGSPTASVTGIGAQRFTVGTSWTRCEAVVAIPATTGVTLGSNGDDFLQLQIYFEAGSSFNLRTGSLGQFTGSKTFQIAQVQVEQGSMATVYEKRSVGEELAMCQRYYIKGVGGGHSGTYFAGNVTSGQSYGGQFTFPVTMRATPSIVFTNTGVTNFSATTGTAYAGVHGVIEIRSASGSGTGTFHSAVEASAEL